LSHKGNTLAASKIAGAGMPDFDAAGDRVKSTETGHGFVNPDL